jgi:crotonobetainyl-CoA:carnitine CoA-transferase CaiB-like acyl-CoA transferase
MQTPPPGPAGPLKGLRVVDLTTVIMGPYATHILADMGADVIKIEAPEGDAFRRYGPSRHDGMGGSILQLHRNKRSVVLDLKQANARTALNRVIESADVLVHNLRPQPAARMALDWTSVQKINPRIILCAARGFGSSGPYANKAAYDDIIQAGSGLAALHMQVHGKPLYVPTAICDKVAGQAIVYALLAALLHRERGGSGQEIEVPMFETLIEFMLAEHLGPGAFEPPLGPIGFARQLSAERKPYRTSDGWACILPYSDRNWLDFFAFIGRLALRDDSRFADMDSRGRNVDDLYRIVNEEAPKHSTHDWIRFCDQASIACMPVLSFDELDDDPHVRAVGLFEHSDHPSEGAYRAVRSSIRFGATPYALTRHAPRLGQDTEDVLREIGLTELQISQLTSADRPSATARPVASTSNHSPFKATAEP